jgi:phage baseplate assembly protein W
LGVANKLFEQLAPPYSDLDLDFFKHPYTKDVAKKTGNEAIKRSIRNLIFTNYYERPFQPSIGSSVTAMLFENATMTTENFLKDAIRACINNFEPRVRLEDIIIDTDYDRNGFNVTLKYTILAREIPVVTTLFLERIR